MLSASDGLAVIRFDELGTGEKEELGLGQGLGVGRKGAAVENRHLAERFARSENMEYLLLAFKGHLEDLHLAARHHVKPMPGSPSKKIAAPLTKRLLTQMAAISSSCSAGSPLNRRLFARMSFFFGIRYKKGLFLIQVKESRRK
jgi:hypothetical protein